MLIVFYVLIAFIGYSAGRIGHIYLGHIKAPHHWIYGAILIIAGVFFYKYSLGQIAFCFGIGHFVSDFKDFLELKFLEIDKEGKKRFWGID